MIEELQFEISRILRRIFLQTNYDATACYDCIIPNLAMVTSRKFGIHESTTITNASTLHSAKYNIRTELGMLETHCSHQSEARIYGTGQGSGNSPMIWCFLSSLLFDAYKECPQPATYCHPDGSNASSLAMIGFVDNSNGQVNCFQEPQDSSTLHTLVKAATHNAVHWAGLLGATGRALELSKCSHHILYWKFHVRGDPVLANAAADVPSISVTDPLTKQIYTLESIPPHSPHTTLGHFKEPAGTQDAQFTSLLAKSDYITDFLWSTPLTRSEAWTYYTACYIPAICYPLTALHMSERQLTKIETKAMSIIVPRCGFNQNTHKSILYGPQLMGGANFRHLAIEQGLLQVQYFLRHWQLQSQGGRLFKNVSHGLVAVVSECFFSDPRAPKYIASTYGIHVDRIHAVFSEPCAIDASSRRTMHSSSPT